MVVSTQLGIWPLHQVYMGLRALKAAETTAPGRNLCSTAGNGVYSMLIGRNKGNWSYW